MTPTILYPLQKNVGFATGFATAFAVTILSQQLRNGWQRIHPTDMSVAHPLSMATGLSRIYPLRVSVANTVTPTDGCVAATAVTNESRITVTIQDGYPSQ